MFVQACLIRKNTKYLRDNLKEFGHIIPPKSFFEDRTRGLLCRPNLAIGLPEDSWEYNLEKYLEENKQIIDCGTNEELFLAIAALRDDTDKNQWFVHKSKSHWWFCTDFDSFKEDYESSNEDSELKFEEWHKVTVEELIKHFK